LSLTGFELSRGDRVSGYHRGGFRLPSDSIDIEKLERESLKLLALGFLISILFHGARAGYIVLFRPLIPLDTYDQTRLRAIPIDIVNIPPRLRDRFVLPGRVPTRRRMIRPRRRIRRPGAPIETKRPERFRNPRNDYAVDADSLIRRNVRPIIEGDASWEIKMHVDPEFFIPERFLADMTIRRDPRPESKRLSLKDELITVYDLDYGEYMGVAVLDDYGRKEISGFAHFPLSVTGTELELPTILERSMQGLADALHMYTDIMPTIDEMIALDDPDLLKYPFIYIAADRDFSLTPLERKNLREYIMKGGFLFAEAYGFPEESRHFMPRGAAPVKKMLEDALGPHARLDIIPNDHMLYHCFFDFDDGPPRITRLLQPETAQPSSVLEGIFIDGRLAVVYSEKEYGAAWAEVDPAEAYRKIGANLVILSLVQRGGMSLKVIGDTAYTR